MSVAGIFSNLALSTQNQQQNRIQQFRQEFQQLGQDLQSGNLTAAQSDFSQIQQLSGQNSSSSKNSISQAFSQLGQDLQSGNLTAAQQDFSTITQDVQNAVSQATHHHHHHHGGGGDGSSQANQIQQAFSDLGQALQSGNLSAAKSAYSTVQQDFQNFALTSNPALLSGSSVNATA